MEQNCIKTSVVHPREIFRTAIYYSAASVILVHNHPSGEPDPSDADKKITKKLFQCGKIMQIPVLDHVIIQTAVKPLALAMGI